MKYDLIIVSQSTGDLIPITQNCIDSARKDEADLNIIVVETGQPHRYDVDTIIQYNGEFNYNRALNMGLNHAKGDIHILANNDIIFHQGWSQIGELMKEYDIDSASALSTDVRQRSFEPGNFIYEGFNIGVHLAGWCIFVTCEAMQKIGRLDETFQFWYSDNVYANQLKAHGLRHGLFCNIHVDHLGSQTLKTLPIRQQRRYSIYSKNLYKLHYAK